MTVKGGLSGYQYIQMKRRNQLTRAIIEAKVSRYERRIIHSTTLKNSAVLIPIVRNSSGLELLFTKRTDAVEHHKGQISFPGGAADPHDASETETALRESFEEIGLDRSAVSILGVLDDLETPSGFKVTPVVGFIDKLPALRTNADEVAALISIPIKSFLDPAKRRSKLIERNGAMIEIYFYEVWDEPIWGATAFFVKQFIEIIQKD